MKSVALILFACATLVIACGPPAANNGASNSAANRAKLGASNSEADANSYSRSENAYTFAQNSDLARDLTKSGKEAREIVGKTVIESKLWQNRMVDERLNNLMGAADFAKMKKFWNTETPIKKFGDFLMMTGCEQHNCADNQYVIFMDLGDGSINVIHIGNDATKEWKGYGEIDLPPPFAQELAAMKSQK